MNHSMDISHYGQVVRCSLVVANQVWQQSFWTLNPLKTLALKNPRNPTVLSMIGQFLLGPHEEESSSANFELGELNGWA